MLKIKLRSNGKIHQRSFRIVVAPARSKSNGKFIDDLGFYTPQTKTFQIDKEKMVQWLKNGAQLTEGVDKLLNPDKYPRIKKTKKTKDVIKKNKKIKEINQDNPQSTTTKPLDSSKVNEQENTKKEVKENEIEKKEIENIENNKEKTEVVKEVEAK